MFLFWGNIFAKPGPLDFHFHQELLLGSVSGSGGGAAFLLALKGGMECGIWNLGALEHAIGFQS